MKNIVLYIGNFEFPMGNAAGKRVLGNAKLFQSLGHNVICIGFSHIIKKNVSLKDTKKIFDGIVYYELPYINDVHRMMFWKINSQVKQLAKEFIESVQMVVLYGSQSNAVGAISLAKWFKLKKIPVISDCVDWLYGTMKNPIITLIKNIDIYLMIRLVNKYVDGNIVISKFFESFYANNPTVLIPPLSDIYYKEKPISLNQDEIRIVYAGSPFRKGAHAMPPDLYKDRLDLCVLYVGLAIQRGANIKFDIYGLTRNDFCDVVDNAEIREVMASVSDKIIFHGRQESSIVEKEIVCSDFTLLIRDQKRATIAGFSTKISESINCGTPVIVNNCGDNNLYIEDGYNGIIISEQKDLAIEQLINLNRHVANTLHEGAQKTQSFREKTYKESLQRFIEMVRISK